MKDGLRILIDKQKKGFIPNIEIINMILSDEVINLPSDGIAINSTFSACMIEESQLTNIEISNGSFYLGGFQDSNLENCTFKNTYFSEFKCYNCVFKNCSFIDCLFLESEISKTIFSNCKFEKGSLSGSEFDSCHFINTSFSDVILIFADIRDSKFSKFNKSITFKGNFLFSHILESQNGISGIFNE